MYYAHPSAGERFYLRLLLTIVKGATSFEDLRSFEGTQYPSFREACIVRGLLEDDNEWDQCLQEARHMQTGYQLRHLFVTILKDCSPADPKKLWETFQENICDDLKNHLWRHVLHAEPSEAQVYDYGLYLINGLLSHSGKSLQNCGNMPQVHENWGAILGNPLIAEQLQYNPEEQAVLAAECVDKLNVDQHDAFNKITSAISTKSGDIFFLHGAGVLRLQGAVSLISVRVLDFE